VRTSLRDRLRHERESMLAAMSLESDLARIATAAASFAEAKETLVGVVPAEPAAGLRLYLCAYQSSSAETSWLVLDAEGRPVSTRNAVREAVSIAALCEVASETAAGGDLAELRAQLAALRETEHPEGVEEAEEAVEALQAVIGSPPVLATPQRLDAIGEATRRVEQALGDGADSPFTRAMRGAADSVQAFTADVEASYKGELN
jgi:hypothetical protein